MSISYFYFFFSFSLSSPLPYLSLFFSLCKITLFILLSGGCSAGPYFISALCIHSHNEICRLRRFAKFRNSCTTQSIDSKVTCDTKTFHGTNERALSYRYRDAEGCRSRRCFGFAGGGNEGGIVSGSEQATLLDIYMGSMHRPRHLTQHLNNSLFSRMK